MVASTECREDLVPYGLSVGRRSINASMLDLGLTRTRLSEDIRTSDWSIRSGLRTSPHDLVHLLALMARRELVG